MSGYTLKNLRFAPAGYILFKIKKSKKPPGTTSKNHSFTESISAERLNCQRPE
jgi:hypothetical protein